MKKLLLVLCLAIISCSDGKVKDIASFEFDGAWYWVVQYQDGATKKDVEDYVTLWANPNQTSFFFVFDKSIDLSVFTKEPFNLSSFSQTVLSAKPKYGYYKMMPGDDKLHDDGIWLLQQSEKQ